MWQLSDTALAQIKNDHGGDSDNSFTCMAAMCDYGCKILVTGLCSDFGYSLLNGTSMATDVSRDALWTATTTGVAIAYPVFTSARIYFCTTHRERNYLDAPDACGQIIWNIKVSSEKVACGSNTSCSRLICKPLQHGAGAAVYTIIGATINGQQINSLIVLKMAGISALGNVALPIVLTSCNCLYLGCANGCEDISCCPHDFYVFELPSAPSFCCRGAPNSEEDMQREQQPLLTNPDANSNSFAALLFNPSMDSASRVAEEAATEDHSQASETSQTAGQVEGETAQNANPGVWERFKSTLGI